MRNKKKLCIWFSFATFGISFFGHTEWLHKLTFDDEWAEDRFISFINKYRKTVHPLSFSWFINDDIKYYIRLAPIGKTVSKHIRLVGSDGLIEFSCVIVKRGQMARLSVDQNHHHNNSFQQTKK